MYCQRLQQPRFVLQRMTEGGTRTCQDKPIKFQGRQKRACSWVGLGLL